MNEIISDIGEIKIHKNLIAQVVETAALNVGGVSFLGLTASKTACLLLSFLRIKPVRINLTKGLRIEIHLIVKYGYNIPQVATSVQQEILKNLSESLNMDTAYIIVKIKGLEKTSLKSDLPQNIKEGQ